MEENSLAHACYWRNSLADAELGYGGLEFKETESFLQLQEQDLATGRVGPRIIKKCFAREAQHIQTVEVVIRPKVYLYRLEHGKRRHSGVPDLVTPLVTRALLARDGRLYPSIPTVIPRDILEPLERGSFVIGTVSDQDEFLTRNPMPSIAFSKEGSVPESDFEQEWASYLAACEQLLYAVGQGWPTGEDGFELAPYGYLAKEESTQGTCRHIIPLYDHIRDHTPIAPLFDRYASRDVSDLEPCQPMPAFLCDWAIPVTAFHSRWRNAML